jgi:hypothetical protein
MRQAKSRRKLPCPFAGCGELLGLGNTRRPFSFPGGGFGYCCGRGGC